MVKPIQFTLGRMLLAVACFALAAMLANYSRNPYDSQICLAAAGIAAGAGFGIFAGSRLLVAAIWFAIAVAIYILAPHGYFYINMGPAYRLCAGLIGGAAVGILSKSPLRLAGWALLGLLLANWFNSLGQAALE